MPYIDPALLLDIGYIQEVNRVFFHPLGLALCIEVEEGGPARIAGVIDWRSDPEGGEFGPGVIDPDKARRIQAEQEARRPAREAALGFWIQPVPHGD